MRSDNTMYHGRIRFVRIGSGVVAAAAVSRSAPAVAVAAAAACLQRVRLTEYLTERANGSVFDRFATAARKSPIRRR
jgi:hypothetical protein